MLYCTHCGTANAATANFCSRCGQPITRTTSDTGDDLSACENTTPAEAPTAVVAARSATDKAVSRNFIARHWRGEYSLGVAYWLFGLLITVFVAALSMIVGELGDSLNLSGRAFGLLLLIYYAVVMVVSVWQIVGVMRSAFAHSSRGGRPFWAVMAMLGVGLGAFRLATSFVVDGLPLIQEGVNMIRGEDGIPAYSLRLMRDDTELELAGGMPMGTTAAVREMLDAHPAIALVHLNSSGGRITEANKLARLIAERKLNTYTRTQCVSACTIAFLAGQERYLGEQGRIGFHSASIAGSTGSAELNVNASFKTALSRVGASPDFIDKATTTTPEDLWFPTTEQLKQAHVITATVDSSTLGLSGFSEWRNVDIIEQALLKQPVYLALSKYDADNYAKLKQLVSERVQRGRSAAEIQTDIQTLISTSIVPGYLRRAPDQALLRYWRSQIAEMRVLGGTHPEACMTFIGLSSRFSMVDMMALIPPALIQEDLAALQAVIEQTASSAAHIKPIADDQKALEHVFIGMTNKDPRSVEIVANPEKFIADPAAVCSAMILMYDTIFSMSDSQAAAGLLRRLTQDAGS